MTVNSPTNPLPELTGAEKKVLRGQAQTLKILVHVKPGGPSPTCTQALDVALNQHGLVKVKFNGHGERAEKETAAEALATQTGSLLVSSVGRTAAYFRPIPEVPEPEVLPATITGPRPKKGPTVRRKAPSYKERIKAKKKR